MKPVYSSVPHRPPHSYGDCYRACIASLLELAGEDVPHVYWNDEEGYEVQQARMDTFLRARGLTMIRMVVIAPSFDELVAASKLWSPGRLFMVCGNRAPNGHVVIVGDGEVLHDPSGIGISGPTELGGYQIEIIASDSMVRT